MSVHAGNFSWRFNSGSEIENEDDFNEEEVEDYRSSRPRSTQRNKSTQISGNCCIPAGK